MATTWSLVSHYEAEDQTEDFGTRQFAESNGCLFECSTMTSIKPDGKYMLQPVVRTISCGPFCCVMIDNTLHILEGENCELRFSNVYESSADCLTFSADWNLLIICLCNGSIFGVNPNTNEAVFEATLEEYESGGKTFINIVSELDYFVIFCCSGSVYRLYNDLSRTNDTTRYEDNNSQALNISIEQMTKHSVCPAPLTAVLNNFEVIYGGEQVCKLGYQGKLSFAMEKGKAIKKMHLLENFDYIFCLMEGGKMCLISLYELFCLPLNFGFDVDDFTIINTPQEENDSSCSMLIFSKNSKRLMLVEYPSMNIKYELDVPNWVFLMHFEGESMELRFLEFVAGEEPQLRVKALTERCPEFRLERMIKRGRFEEADSFADRFHLLKDAIHMARARREIKAYWESEENLYSSGFEKLIKLLDNITDNMCVADCCTTALSHSSQNTDAEKKLLAYAINRLTNVQSAGLQLKHFQDLLLKLETYRLLDVEVQCTLPWSDFRCSRPLDVCLELVGRGDECSLMAAAAVWSRHYAAVRQLVTGAVADRLLGGLPKKLHPAKVLPCLRHFVPGLIRAAPACLGLIIDWAREKAGSFEKTHLTEWPSIGRDFCETIIELLNLSDCSNAIILSKEVQLKELISLKNSLSELIILKEQYKISLSLSKYVQPDFPEVAKQLVNQVSVNYLEEFLDKFLKPRLLMNGLIDLNQLIANFVAGQVRKSNRNNAWEIKLSAVIKFISNEQIALECISRILEAAALPWSPVIMQLYERGSSSKHELSSDIDAIYRFTGARLIMSKHNFEGIENDEREMLMLVEKVLCNGRPDAMVDIQQLIKSYPDIEKAAFDNCVYHHLYLGDIIKALAIIDSLSEENKKYCLNSVILMARILISKKKLQQRDIGFFEILECLKYFYDESTHEGQEQIEKIEYLNSMYSLKTKFDIHLNHDEFYQKKLVQGFVTQGVANLIQKQSIEDDMYFDLQVLAKLLRVQLHTVILELSKQTRNLRLVLDCVSKMLETNLYRSADGADLVRLAAHIISLHGKQRLMSFDGFPSEVPGLPEPNLLNEIYSLAFKLMNLYAVNSPLNSQLAAYSKLHSWIEIGAVSVADSLSVLEKKPDKQVSKIHSVDNVYNDSLTTADVRNILGTLTSMIISLFSSEDQGHDLHKLFAGHEVVPSPQVLMTKMQSTQAYLTTLRMAQLLQLHHNTAVPSEYWTRVLPKLQQNALLKMAGRRNYDLPTSMAILATTGNPDEVMEQMFAQLNSQPLRQLNVVTLSQEFHVLKGQMRCGPVYDRLMSRKKACAWSIKLSELNMNAPDLIRSTCQSPDWHLPVLKRLYSLPASYDLLKEFCHDFCMTESLQRVVIRQLTKLLSSVKLEFELVTNKLLKKEIVVSLPELAILDKCSEYVDNIINRDELLKQLENLLDHVNFYHYELFVVILELLMKFGATEGQYRQWLDILKFLKQYIRSTPPGQIEMDDWMKTFPSDCNIPPISKYRLPFTALTKQTAWDMIKNELNVWNCESWLAVVSIFPLSGTQQELTDKFCQYAIKNTMLAVFHAAPKGVWNLTMQEEVIRNQTLKVLKNVSSMERYSQLLYFIMNYSAEGADRVVAAKLCYEFGAECNVDNIDVEKLRKRYPLFAGIHILLTNKLEDTALTELVRDPQELIFALYNHPIVLRNARTVVSDDPDINKVVAEIGQLHSTTIDLPLIKYTLLKNWLQSNSSTPGMDDSMTMALPHNNFDIAQSTNAADMNWDDDLLRACYILKSYDRTMVVELLGDYIINSEHNTYPLSTRLRALRCMLAVADSKTIAQKLGLNEQDLNELFLQLSTMNYLEELGYSYTQSEYHNLKKDSLVLHLLENLGSNSAALRLCLLLCQNNDIFKDTIWSRLMKCLVQLEMLPELESSLEWLRSKPSLCSLPAVAQAWQCLIRIPLIQADAKRNPDQEQSCAAALLKLQCCPVVSSLDMVDLAECCINADRPYMAAAMLPFADQNSANSILKIIKSKSNPRSLEEDVKSLQELGILFVPKIIEALHANLDSLRFFMCIWRTDLGSLIYLIFRLLRPSIENILRKNPSQNLTDCWVLTYLCHLES